MHDHLIQLARIRVHAANAAVEGHFELDVLAQQAPQHRNDGAEPLVQVDPLGRDRSAPAEGQQLRRQLPAAGTGPPDLQSLGGPLVAFERSGQDVRVAVDHGQEVVEVVGHAAGKAAERLHLGGVVELLFELLVGRDVLDGGDGETRRGAFALDRPDVDASPDGRPVLAEIALDQLVAVGAPIEQVRQGAPGRLSVGFVGVVQYRQPGQFVRAIAEQPVEGAVALESPAVAVAQDHADRGVVEDGAHAHLTLGRGPFGGDPFADVAGDDLHGRTAAEDDRLRRDLDIELRAVAANMSLRRGLDGSTVREDPGNAVADGVPLRRDDEVPDPNAEHARGVAVGIHERQHGHRCRRPFPGLARRLPACHGAGAQRRTRLDPD